MSEGENTIVRLRFTWGLIPRESQLKPAVIRLYNCKLTHSQTLTTLATIATRHKGSSSWSRRFLMRNPIEHLSRGPVLLLAATIPLIREYHSNVWGKR